MLLGIAGMFRVSPDSRVAAGRQALGLPELSAHLRARHFAALFHNLLVGGRAQEAKSDRRPGGRGCGRRAVMPTRRSRSLSPRALLPIWTGATTTRST